MKRRIPGLIVIGSQLLIVGLFFVTVFNTDINKNFSKVCEDISFCIEEGLKNP